MTWQEAYSICRQYADEAERDRDGRGGPDWWKRRCDRGNEILERYGGGDDLAGQLADVFLELEKEVGMHG
jgi:hypothetical protein